MQFFIADIADIADISLAVSLKLFREKPENVLKNKTTIIVSHNIKFILKLCDDYCRLSLTTAEKRGFYLAI